MGKSILITSGKGGSGSTTFAANLASVIAKSGSGVLLVDLNLGFRNDDIYLGLENRVLFDLGDVVSGMCSADKAIIRSDSCANLFLLPSPQGRMIPYNLYNELTALIDSFRIRYDFVIIDCPASIDGVMDFVAPVCDTALLVVSPDYVCIRNTDMISKRLYAMGLVDRYFALNKVFPSSFNDSFNPEKIVKTLEIPMAGIISFNLDIDKDNNAGHPTVLNDSSEFTKSFIDIATLIVV